jgi:hypothetical protein
MVGRGGREQECKCGGKEGGFILEGKVKVNWR